MATIDDVARAAEVSRSTVSYVLSGKRPISATTRRRVERAIADLGYRPHASARALASQRTEIIGLMAPLRVGVDVGIIMQFVAGVVLTARNFNYDVLLLTNDDTDAADRVATSALADALIMMDIESDDPRLPALAGFPRPLVLIGIPGDATGLNCVDLDFRAAGRLAVRRLRELGHQRIALIASPPSVVARHTCFADRLRLGFTDEHPDTDDENLLMVNAETSYAAAQQIVRSLFSTSSPPTALVIHNEAALPHLLTALRRDGRSVPEDVSVIAICPANVAEAQQQPISSIDIPTEEIARVAVEMLIARLSDPRPPETRLLAPQLTERGSTRVR